MKSWTLSSSKQQPDKNKISSPTAPVQPGGGGRQRSASSASLYVYSNQSQSSSTGSLIHAYLGSSDNAGTGITTDSVTKTFKKPPMPVPPPHRRNRSMALTAADVKAVEHDWKQIPSGIKRKASKGEASASARSSTSPDEDYDNGEEDVMERSATASLRKLNLGPDDDDRSSGPPNQTKKKKRLRYLQSLDLRSRSTSSASTSSQATVVAQPAAEMRISSPAVPNDTHSQAHQQRHQLVHMQRVGAESSLAYPASTPFLFGRSQPSAPAPPLLSSSPPLDPIEELQNAVRTLKIRVHELETIVAQKDHVIRILKHEIQRPPEQAATRASCGSESRTTAVAAPGLVMDRSNSSSLLDISHSYPELSSHLHTVPQTKRETPKLELDFGTGQDFSVDSISLHLSMTEDTTDGSAGGGDAGSTATSLVGENQHQSMDADGAGAVSNQPSSLPVKPAPATTVWYSILPSSDDEDARFDHVIDQQYYGQDNSSFEVLGPYSVDMRKFKSRADPYMAGEKK